MEYYILKEAVDTKETGSVFPQAVFKNRKKLNPDPFLLANMANDGEYPPDNILSFDYLELARGAKLTDLMTSPFSMNGFLISKKLKEVFEREGVVDCRYYPVVLFNKDKEIKDYFYFHSASCLRKYVDYYKSKFYVGVSVRRTHEYDISVKSYSELNEIKSKLESGLTIYPEHYYLSANFPFNNPLFRILAFNYDFFITRKLKEAMELSKVTGALIISSKELIRTPNLS